jgi:hypothetical protein
MIIRFPRASMWFKEPMGRRVHEPSPGMLRPDLRLMQRASKKRQLSIVKKHQLWADGDMSGKRWISYRKAFGRDRDFNYFHSHTWEGQFADFPLRGGALSRRCRSTAA